MRLLKTEFSRTSKKKTCRDHNKTWKFLKIFLVDSQHVEKNLDIQIKKKFHPFFQNNTSNNSSHQI